MGGVTKVEDHSVRAQAYGRPGVTVDGNDVFAVYEAGLEAAERARKGEGPTLIECKTYRHHGHYEGDPQMYKAKEEVEKWMANDPINKLGALILSNKYATQEELDALAKAAADEMEASSQYALAAEFPDPSEALEDVYAMENERCVL